MSLSQRIWHIANMVTLGMVLLSCPIVYWQLVRGPELQPVALRPLDAVLRYAQREATTFKEVEAEMLLRLDELPQPVVQRTAELLATIDRGTIYDRNGRALAYDRDAPDGEPGRFYAEPSLAHVVGYVSGLRLGVAGVEAAFNETLLGLDRLDAQLRRMVHQRIVGSDVHLTVDSRVQRAAAEALGGRAGAVVVLDARTGAVLAMASAPAFDPNGILEEDYVRDLVEACQGAPECRSSLYNRATQGLYVPGSLWKTVTLIAALDSGQVTPETVFDFGEPRTGPDGIYYVYEVDGAVFEDPNHDERRLNLERSYAVSANAAFARMGHEMPADVMIDYAARLGFSRPGDGVPPLEIAVNPSQVANDPEALYANNVLRVSTAFGQGELLATPLNMALLVLSVLNGGDIPAPHLLKAVYDPLGRPRTGEPAGTWIRGAMRPETAETVRGMMIAVVQSGSGRRAAVSGMTVGGKTGTAELGGGVPPHAWFAGFAEEGERAVVIAVIVENGGEGSQTAAPLFAQVAEVALRHAGEPVEESAP